MTTPSKPPFRFFGMPKSKSTKSLTTGPTSLIFVPDRRCAAAGANRSRPWNVSESSGRPSLRFVISRTSLSPSRRAAGITSPLSGPTRRAPSRMATMARRFVPTPGSTTPTWTAKGKYGTAEYRTNAPCRTSCGRTLWSRSTIVSSESMERMAPFIAPTYPPGPKSVVSVTIPVICHPSPNLLETFFDALELLLPTFQVGIFFPGLCLRLFEFRLAEGVALEGFLHRGPIGRDLPLHRLEFRGAVLNGLSQGRQGLLAPFPSCIHPVGPGPPAHPPCSSFEPGLLRLMLPTKRRLAGLQILHGCGLRIRAMTQSELSCLRRLLALLELLLAAIHVGFPLGQIAFERLGRPDSLLEGFFGAEQLRPLFLQSASRLLNLCLGPAGLAPLSLKLPRLGRELALPPLELLGFPADLLLLGGEFAVLSREVLRNLLPALGGPDEFVPPFRQGRGLRHNGLLSLRQGRDLRGQLRLPTIEIIEPCGGIPFSIGKRLLPFRQRGLLPPHALLEPDEGLLPPDEFSLARLGFPEARVEGRARFRDLLRL